MKNNMGLLSAKLSSLKEEIRVRSGKRRGLFRKSFSGPGLEDIEKFEKRMGDFSQELDQVIRRIEEHLQRVQTSAVHEASTFRSQPASQSSASRSEMGSAPGVTLRSGAVPRKRRRSKWRPTREKYKPSEDMPGIREERSSSERSDNNRPTVSNSKTRGEMPALEVARKLSATEPPGASQSRGV
jgi:hypothetical protein